MKQHAPLWYWAVVGGACGVAVALINPFTRAYLATGGRATLHGAVGMARDGALLAAVFVAVGLLIRLVTKGMSL